MNYYNPYYMFYPMPMARPGLFSALRGSLRGINFNSIFNGTQRTLNVINQAIPLVKQVTPVMKNAKTMFRVMNEFKKTDNPRRSTNNYNIANKNSHEEYGEGPKFFV